MEILQCLRLWLAMVVYLRLTYTLVGSVVALDNNLPKPVSRAEIVNVTFVPSLRSGRKEGPARRGLEEGFKCSGADGTKCQFSSCGEGQQLPKCAIGFATGVTGGKGGLSYTVTTSDDDPSNPAQGTLRYGLNLYSSNPKGLWITFSRDMTIRLEEMLYVYGRTTIDGRGAKVIVTGSAIALNKVQNVIIHNIQVSDTDFDTVHIFESSKVWVDHVTSFNGKLGLIYAIQGSTDVTISNCRLLDNHYNMLLGSDDSDTIDKNMRVTVYRNWFKNLAQRSPHCRWGYCHVVNNLYDNWGDYAIGARVQAQIYAEKNVFIPGETKEVTEWYPGYNSKWDTTPRIESNGDLLLGSATFHEFLSNGRVSPPPYKNRVAYPPTVDTDKLQSFVNDCSGVLLKESISSCLSQG